MCTCYIFASYFHLKHNSNSGSNPCSQTSTEDGAAYLADKTESQVRFYFLIMVPKMPIPNIQDQLNNKIQIDIKI